MRVNTHTPKLPYPHYEPRVVTDGQGVCVCRFDLLCKFEDKEANSAKLCCELKGH